MVYSLETNRINRILRNHSLILRSAWKRKISVKAIQTTGIYQWKSLTLQKEVIEKIYKYVDKEKIYTYFYHCKILLKMSWLGKSIIKIKNKSIHTYSITLYYLT